jgi:3-hydroxyisobutyrate dehydrogenase
MQRKELSMKLTPEKTTIGFVGTGVMGRSMAAHLVQAGFPLQIYTRTKAKAQQLLDQGAVWHDSPAAIAAECNLVITIVGFPQDVEEVYLGTEGILSRVRPESYLIDMTTSRPDLAVNIYTRARNRGCHALDAPVSGGDIGAREARLSIMVGGDRGAFDDVLPVLQLMGDNVVYQGAAGSGQHTKMANQIAIAAGMLGVCEAIAYAQKSGLDPETVLKSIAGGAAGSWSLSNLGPRMIAGDFSPGFYVKHFLKDMEIAASSAKSLGLSVPGLDLAKTMYEQLASRGEENSGTQALYRLYE